MLAQLIDWHDFADITYASNIKIFNNILRKNKIKLFHFNLIMTNCDYCKHKSFMFNEVKET